MIHGANRFADRLLDGFASSETNFGFRRMNVDVNFLERNFQKKKRDRINAVRQHRAKTFQKSARDDFVSDEATVDEKVLRVARRSSFSRSAPGSPPWRINIDSTVAEEQYRTSRRLIQ